MIRILQDVKQKYNVPKRDEDYYNYYTYCKSQGFILPQNYHAIEQFIVDLKINGIWQKIDFLYSFGGDLTSTNAKFVNIKNPGENHISPSNSNYNFNGNGLRSSGASFNLNYSPSLSENWLNNQCGLFCYLTEASITGNIITSSSGLRWLLNNSNTHLLNGINNLDSSFNNTGIGYKSFSRYTNNELLLVNGENFSSKNSNGNIYPTGNFTLLNSNTTTRIAILGGGNSLSIQDNIKLGICIQDYLNKSNISLKVNFPISNSNVDRIVNYSLDHDIPLPTNFISYQVMVNELIENEILEKFDVFYNLSGDGTPIFKLLNIATPEFYDGTQSGDLLWEINGCQGAGTNGHIVTNYNPRSHADKRKVGDASITGIVTQLPPNINTNGTLWGANDSFNADITSVRTSAFAKKLDGNFSNLANIAQVGIYSINRDSSEIGSNIGRMITGSNEQALASTTAQTLLTNGTQTIHRSTSTYGRAKIACWMTGASLTFQEVNKIKYIFNNYLIQIGSNPVP